MTSSSCQGDSRPRSRNDRNKENFDDVLTDIRALSSLTENQLLKSIFLNIRPSCTKEEIKK